jgi:hypothetical protein
MSAVDLAAEFSAAKNAVTWKHIARFKALGLTADAELRVGGVGVARIAEHRGGIYDLDEAGVPALIFAVWDGPICDAEDRFSYPSPLIDLAAWRPGAPDAPLLTRRDVGTVLGVVAILGARLARQPLRVFGNPVRWAAAGGDAVGIVVIDWSAHGDLLDVDTIVAEDIAHGEEIKHQLQKLRRRLTPSLPDIAVATASPASLAGESATAQRSSRARTVPAQTP